MKVDQCHDLTAKGAGKNVDLHLFFEEDVGSVAKLANYFSLGVKSPA